MSTITHTVFHTEMDTPTKVNHKRTTQIHTDTVVAHTNINQMRCQKSSRFGGKWLNTTFCA